MPPVCRASARPRWIGLALAAGVLAIYAQTLAFDFVVFDDDKYVTQNPTVQEGLTSRSLGWAFTTHAVSAWHPLTWLSHMLDAQLFGAWAGGHHATNVALHALAAVLAFVALRELSGATWRSAAAAALFAWHPLRVESVAWVSERKDVLSGVFAMLALWGYARYARTGSRRAWLGAFVALALGLLAKPTLVPLPFALLLLDVWPLARREPWSRLVLEKLPFVALSGGAIALTLAFQRSFLWSLEQIPPAARVASATVAIATYLRKLVWPADLAPLYPHPYLPEQGGVPLEAGAIAASAALVLVITLAVLRARSFPPLAVGWLWFLGLLVPTLGIVSVGRQALADRYTYLPSLGLAVALVWGASALFAHTPSRRRLLRGAAALLLAGYGAAAFAQTRHWRDSEALLRHALAVSPRATAMRSNLARWLHAQERLDEAGEHYRAALELNPRDARLHYHLGRLLYRQGRPAQALEQLRTATTLDPRDPQAAYLFGLLLESQGRAAEAIESYRRAAELEPENPKPRERLRAVLTRPAP